MSRANTDPDFKGGRSPLYPTVFASKLWDIAEEDETNDIVGWDETGTTFVIRKPHLFIDSILSKYFQHQNMCSFIRQLNLYGFSKTTESTILEFRHPHFVRGNKPDIRFIRRRKTDKRSSVQENVETYEQPSAIQKYNIQEEQTYLNIDPNTIAHERIFQDGADETINIVPENTVEPFSHSTTDYGSSTQEEQPAPLSPSSTKSLQLPQLGIIQEITNEIRDTKGFLSVLRSEVYKCQNHQDKTKDVMHVIFREVQRLKSGVERRVSDVSYTSTSAKQLQGEDAGSLSGVDLQSNTASLSDHSERDSPGFTYPPNLPTDKTPFTNFGPNSAINEVTDSCDFIEPFRAFDYFE